MAVDGNQIITIMRNVTGRIDASDPLFTDAIMLQYANNFLNLIQPQEVRLYENKTWWEFTLQTTDPDPYPVVLQDLGYSTLGPPAYVGGFDVQWFQSPALFYSKWPETQTYQTQRPVDILYYNNQLVFRGPPDQSYSVKISAYQIEVVLENENDTINYDYMFRYIAYGASLDIFSDYGEIENWNKYYPIFRRYRSLIYARTNQQLMSQRTFPNF